MKERVLAWEAPGRWMVVFFFPCFSHVCSTQRLPSTCAAPVFFLQRRAKLRLHKIAFFEHEKGVLHPCFGAFLGNGCVSSDTGEGDRQALAGERVWRMVWG